MGKSWDAVLWWLRCMGVLGAIEVFTVLYVQYSFLFVHPVKAEPYLLGVCAINSIASMALIPIIGILNFRAFFSSWESTHGNLNAKQKEKLMEEREKKFWWWLGYACLVWSISFSINLTSLVTLALTKDKYSSNFRSMLMYHEFTLGFALYFTFLYSYEVVESIFYTITHRRYVL